MVANEGIEQVELTEPWQAVMDAGEIPEQGSAGTRAWPLTGHGPRCCTMPSWLRETATAQAFVKPPGRGAADPADLLESTAGRLAELLRNLEDQYSQSAIAGAARPGRQRLAISLAWPAAWHL